MIPSVGWRREVFGSEIFALPNDDGVDAWSHGRHGQAPLTVREAAFCERLELMPDRSRLTPGQHFQSPCSAHTCPRVASTRQVQLKGGSFHANKAWQEIKEMLQIPNPIAFIHLVNQPQSHSATAS